jgi:ubiquinone/menaquinone biosynthesis C-methylase UbiE
MKEFGHLTKDDKNRYWKIKLSRFHLLNNGSSWLYRVCWYVLTLIMLFPLFAASRYYSAKFRLAEKRKGKDISSSYNNFTDIYPFCVYSPFIKGMELELFQASNFAEPVLEIGIGDGYFSSLLFGSKQNKLAYGADLIYGTLKSATKYNHVEKFLIMDALEIPLPDNCLGTIIMNNLIHHLPDRLLTLKESLRVLKKGGKFIFTDNTMGWGVFTWEQIALRKLHLRSLADKILKFKLKLFAQRLLVDHRYYDEKSKELDFKVTKKIDFASKTAMYLSSLFEFLNLKQGQPTRKEMIRWSDVFGFKNTINSHVKFILEYCFAIDRELCEKEGHAYQFIEIENLKESSLKEQYAPGSIPYVCPRCKKPLDALNDSFACNHCDINYPVIDGIPIFISYQTKLKGFDAYVKKRREEKDREYVT